MKKYYLLVLIWSIILLSCTLPFQVSINTSSKGEGELENPAQQIKEPEQISIDNIIPASQIDFSMRIGIGGYLYPDIEFGEETILAATRELDKLGMVWLRHPGRGISWYEVQPTRDTWDFSKLDAVTANNSHPWLLPIYGMIGNAYPFEGNLNQAYLESLGEKADIMDYIIAHSVNMDDPQHRADAEIYVKTFVDRYKDTVKYWEIGGNEGIGSAERLGIVQYTYQWIKEVDPQAIVIMTAICGDDDDKFYNGLDALDNLLAQGAGNFFDIANMHYYGRVEGDFEKRLETRFDDFSKVLRKYDVQKPIWVTETSTSSATDYPLSGQSSEQLQARHIVQRMVIFLAKGADKVFWYDYGALSEGDLFFDCNIMGEQDQPKPAYYTFQMIVEQLGHFEQAKILSNNGIFLYEFTKSDGSSVHVAWAESVQKVDLSTWITGQKVIVTHIIEDTGQTQPQIEQAPTNKVSLTESPVFITLP